MIFDGACPECGFRWLSIEADGLSDALLEETVRFNGVIGDAGALAAQRPEPGRWSILEYGCHLRDVLLTVRERIIQAAIIDGSVGQAIYRDERVRIGLYAQAEPEPLMEELTVAARLLTTAFDALDASARERTFQYSPVTPEPVTVVLATAQALHESRHHRGDIETNLTWLTEPR